MNTGISEARRQARMAQEEYGYGVDDAEFRDVWTEVQELWDTESGRYRQREEFLSVSS